MSAYEMIGSQLQSILPSAKLKQYTFSSEKAIELWLIDPEGWDQPLDEFQASSIFETPPYWSFCWGSGQVLANWIFAHSEQVRGKTVLDFGSGSGIVAIAAALSGAGRIIACDCDPSALQAAEANAELNQVSLDYLPDFNEAADVVDILFAADVLYDPENFGLVKQFLHRADQVILADSRIKNFAEPGYQKIYEQYAVTLPDLGENEDVKKVRVYQGKSSGLASWNSSLK